jgi:hypothetical protein
MIVSKINKWNDSHSELSKYFIERLLQLSDYDEVISNRHKTTNGYILLSEINDVTKMVINRQKSIHRFKTLMNECLDSNLPFSLTNDFILDKYHPDIIHYYKNFGTDNSEQTESKIKKLQTQTRVYLKKLDLEYYDNLKNEFRTIDLNDSKKIRTIQSQLDILVEILVPFLIFKGYSVESISKVAIMLASKKMDPALRLFFSVFNLENVDVEFLFSTDDLKDNNILLYNFLRKQNIDYTEHLKEDLKLKPYVAVTDHVIKFKISTIDPNSFIRATYDQIIKDFIISKDRISLDYFTDFFEKTFWKLLNGKNDYKSSGFRHDPINVKARPSTLITTLINTSSFYNLNFTESSSLYKIEGIGEALYFYNLALGSKSIENSMNLLWTALETLIPYSKYDNDIGNIQYFFPKFLSIGAVGRQIMSFVLRFQTTNSQNEFILNSLKTHIDYKSAFDIDTLIKWLDYTTFAFEKENDPYDLLKSSSELLCAQFCKINEGWGGTVGEYPKHGKLKIWKKRIDLSCLSIKYQLDRIYLHRNQIVHTAKFINEYSNLWAHLEWYVGKILSYFFIKAKGNKLVNKKELLIELEGECEMVYKLIERMQEKRIIDLNIEEKRKIFMHIWQFS